MKTVTLAGTGIQTTVLGFGCNTLLGDRTRAQALETLAAAFDAGIRHFDVAPSYGQGMAEEILGEFVQGRRGEVTIATKFGLEPSLPAAARSGFVRQVVRKIMRVSPGVRRVLGRASGATLKKGLFQPDAAQRSLERSLRLLRTDRIDVLLLHACELHDLAEAGELLEFLRRMLREGKIRAFGIGASNAATEQISHEHPEFTDVAQFTSSVLIPSVDTIQLRGAVITHGALAGSFAAIQAHLSAQPEVARRWSEALGVDCSNATMLAALMLAHAVRANTRGPVLFSSRSPARVRENARLLEECQVSDAQLDLFATLATESRVQPV